MNALTIPAFQDAAARLNAMSGQASKVLAELKRAPTSDELDDEWEAYASALSDAGACIARAEKAMHEQSDFERAQKLGDQAIEELGGVPATPLTKAAPELVATLELIAVAAAKVAALSSCGERETLTAIAELARTATKVAGVAA
jgi:hypothetical protein